MTEPPYARQQQDGPLSRAERQRRTRAALVESARRTFAAEGFHGATLDTIANNAGLSKGAVYSNFDSKADLFLAVMDADLAGVEPETWDPVERFGTSGEPGSEDGGSPPFDEDELRRGFALATLEFSAMAGRDPELANALGRRVGGLVAAFRPIVRRNRAVEESIDEDHLAAMLIAYEQGAALLTLAGGPRIGPSLISRGFARLLTPAPEEDPD